MRFTLTYRGPLRGGGNVAHKHEVRRALHPQLKELWTHDPLAHKATEWLGRPSSASGAEISALREERSQRFAVVVQHQLRLVAELDILLLRPEAPGALIQRADIDNRLKTLFDALRRPSLPQEVPADWSPSPDEEPLHCLLDDDRLITRVNIDTDRLLAPDSADDVELTIRVAIRASSPSYASLLLVS